MDVRFYPLAKKRHFAGGVAVLAASVFLFGCSDSSSSRRAPVEVTPEVITGDKVEPTRAALEITGQIVDAKTGAAIDGAKVSFSGADASKITVPESQPIPGLVTFTASSQDLSVKVLAEKDGYLSTGMDLLTSDSEHANFEIRMVSTAPGAAPEGTKVAVVSASDLAGYVDAASGQVTQEIVVEAKVDSGDAAGEATTLRVPQGTVLKDIDGNTVTGQISMIVAHHSASEVESTDAFPGGFSMLALAPLEDNPDNLNNPTTEDRQISFVTAGFTSITIQNEAGEKVRNFSTPVEVRMQIKEGLNNPKTGAPIAVGDKVPVWSYNEDDGKWTYEQNGDVIDQDPTDGFLDVVTQVTHLSYWNLDWHYSAVCQDSRLNVRDQNGDLLEDFQVRMKAKFTNQSGYLYQGTIYGDGFANLRNLPKNKEIEFTATIDGVEVGSRTATVTDSTCGNEIDLVADTSLLPPLYPVTVDVVTFCENGSVHDAERDYFGYLYADNRWNFNETPFTMNLPEGSETEALISKAYLPSGATIDGGVSWGSYASKSTTVAAGENKLTFAITLAGNTEQCLTNPTPPTGATGGASGGQGMD